MRKHNGIILAGLALSLWGLTACGTSADEGQAADGQTAQALTEWEQSADIYNNDMSEDELYEKAKAEGKVVLYSGSSRCEAVAEAFMEKYPGITVEAFDISINELIEKVSREYTAGVHNADVIHVKDMDGSLYNEYVLEKKLYNYQPSDICAHIDESLLKYQTPLYIELGQWFYNTEAYPDGSPIDSVWDLTRPEWRGRVMMVNPADNMSNMSLITGYTLDETAAALEALYEEEFGEPLVLSEDCRNAGYEFLKRLRQNDPIFATNSDEIAESVGTAGQKNPPVGLLASSKLRKVQQNGWTMAPINIKPNTGIPQVNTLYIVEGCEHPYAAKLLIRFMMGDADGKSEGYAQFNTLGGWPVRDDIAPPEGATPYEELLVDTFDPMAIYENIGEVQDFWLLADKNA